MALNTTSLANSSRMTKVWMLGGTAGCLLLAALAWFVVVSPALSRVSSVKSQVATANSQNDVLRIKLSQLQSEKAGIGTLRNSLVSALDALPPSSNMADFTDQLQTQAAAAHVALTSIAAGTPSIASQSGSATTTTTTTTTTTPAPAPAAAGAGAATAGALYAIPVTVVADGDLSTLNAFLKSIQAVGPRRALVVSTAFAPVSQSSSASIQTSVAMTTSLEVFTAPMTPDQAAQLGKLLGQNPGQ